MLSSTVWANVWATYSQHDGCYADRRACGFNVDIANGFVTPVPTAILYAAFTFDFPPAVVAGIVGATMFWQLTYATSVYWVGFFGANRQARIGRRDMCVYIWTLNCPRVPFALSGLHASIRPIVDGDYGVAGYRSRVPVQAAAGSIRRGPILKISTARTTRLATLKATPSRKAET